LEPLHDRVVVLGVAIVENVRRYRNEIIAEVVDGIGL
jgi:hypothetical protein